jgi:exodeoxyribonuclease VII small subunit
MDFYMSDNKTQEDIESLTFEAALKSLEEIVSQLDAGSIDLDKAVEAYERGAKLKEHCEKKLREAQLRIEKIEVDKNGEITTKVMDTE